MKKILIILSLFFVAHSVFANVVFNGDFETGDYSQWETANSGLNCPNPSTQAHIVTNPVRRGTYSTEMVVHDGDELWGGERCDLERPHAHDEHKGDDYWYQWSTYFPADWQNLTGAPDDDWLVIADWHATGDPDFENVCQPLQIEMNASNQLMAKMLTGDVTGYDCFDGSGSANSYEQVIVNGVELGKWNDFVIHVKWTPENTGSVEIWHKTGDETSFNKVFDKKGVPTMQYVNTISNVDSPYFILADYRSLVQANTATLYHDDFKQMTSVNDLDDKNGIWWQPKASQHLTWQWDLSDSNLDTSLDVDVYDIDLFDAPQSKIDQLHNDGKKVICYFSAGSYEDWRDDEGDFPASVKGNDLDNWAGEKWLDIREGLGDVDGNGTSDSVELRNIMKARLDMAVAKNCDGVEPDNVDGYSNNTGFPLTASDQLTYNNWLATEAHNRNLSIGLKNDIDQINDLIGNFDWALNEQCYQYNECDGYQTFITADKPVFGVEYNLEPSEFCPQANTSGYSWLKKHLNLDSWRYGCEDYNGNNNGLTNISGIWNLLANNFQFKTFFLQNGSNLKGFMVYNGNHIPYRINGSVNGNQVSFSRDIHTTIPQEYITTSATDDNLIGDFSHNNQWNYNWGADKIANSGQYDDLSGTWVGVANGYDFVMNLTVSDYIAQGTIHFSDSGVDEDIIGYVDGHNLSFFRDNSQLVNPQEFQGVFNGNTTLSGNFSHNGQWNYSWEAEKVTNSGQYDDLSGTWVGAANGYDFVMNLTVLDYIAQGTIHFSASGMDENVIGYVDGNKLLFFRDNNQLVNPQEFQGVFDGTTLSGSFRHNGQWNYNWEANRGNYLTQEVDWFLAQHQDLKDNYFVGKFGVDNNPSGWDTGAYMRAYIDMYEASHDVRILRKLDELLKIVADGNDILTNRADDRTGTVLPGWGIRENFGQNGDSRYSEMLANALDAYPLAAFARIVKENSSLQSEFGSDADRYYNMIAQLYSVQNPFVADGDSPYGDSTQGMYYQYPNNHIEDGLDYSNREAPINLTVIIAEPLIELYRASVADGNPNTNYRDIVTQVGNYIWWNTTQQTSNGDHFLTWYYWPADIDPNSQDRMEDLTHGARLAEFVYSLYDANLRDQWTESKLQQLANTFTIGAIIDYNNITFANYIDGTAGAYNDDAATLYEWLELQKYSHFSSKDTILHYIRTAMQNQGDDEEYNIAVFAKFARFSIY